MTEWMSKGYHGLFEPKYGQWSSGGIILLEGRTHKHQRHDCRWWVTSVHMNAPQRDRGDTESSSFHHVCPHAHWHTDRCGILCSTGSFRHTLSLTTVGIVICIWNAAYTYTYKHLQAYFKVKISTLWNIISCYYPHYLYRSVNRQFYKIAIQFKSLTERQKWADGIYFPKSSCCMYVNLHECWLVRATAPAAITETKGMKLGVLFKQKGSNQTVIM